METLQQIGEKYQTDKAITHFYCDNYEKYLAPLRYTEITILELGVAGGASIRMWREYMPFAKVFGVDNNPDCIGEGIFNGDATDELFMQGVLEEIGEVDILIDDSSHIGWDMIKIFEFMFPKIKSGGYFVLEDTHVLYNAHYEQGSGAFNFFTGLVRHVDVEGKGMCGFQDFCIDHPSTEPPVPKYSRYLKAIHFYTSLWIFERK